MCVKYSKSCRILFSVFEHSGSKGVANSQGKRDVIFSESISACSSLTTHTVYVYIYMCVCVLVIHFSFLLFFVAGAMHSALINSFYLLGTQLVLPAALQLDHK